MGLKTSGGGKSDKETRALAHSFLYRQALSFLYRIYHLPRFINPIFQMEQLINSIYYMFGGKIPLFIQQIKSVILFLQRKI